MTEQRFEPGNNDLAAVGRPSMEDQAILDLVHESIYARDLDRKITFWNAAAEELYGWTRDEAMGQDAPTLLSCEYPLPIAECEAELFASGHWQGELTRRTKSGAQVHVDVVWAVRRDASGESVEIIETGRDVTQKRKEAAAQRLAEFRYRNLFEVMAVAFWEIDFKPVGDRIIPLLEQGGKGLREHLLQHRELVRDLMRSARVLDVNTKTIGLFGAAHKQEMVGHDIERYWPRESETVFIDALVATMEHEPYLITETKLLDLTGQSIDVLFTVSWSPESRREGIVLLGVVDISDRIRAERRLQQVRAEFAHAARVATLGELAASIAHEVNQPLAAIATNGEASLRWLNREEPDLDEVRTLAARMVADARRAAEIIARIRGMASNQEPQSELLNINDVVQDTLQFLQRELQANAIELRLELDDKLPPVSSDRTQLQQVLVNLGVNAIHAMQAETVGNRQLTVRTGFEADRVWLEVEDTGTGVAQDLRQRLFESFFTTKAQGLGIGLAICRSIIEGHGGAITCEDSASGALFRVALPAQR